MKSFVEFLKKQKDEEDSDDNSNTGDEEGLQTVFFHPCRCGDTFQVFQEEVVTSIGDAKESTDGLFTNRVWQCESCSLTIRIHVDIDLNQ